MDFNVDINNLGEVKKTMRDIVAHHITERVHVVLNDHSFDNLTDDLYDSIHTEIMITLNSLNLS